ncbi:MAG: hypothetical protein V7767_05350 [Leeuwenhoekiella sp.]
MKKIIILVNLLCCLSFLVSCEEGDLERANYVSFESTDYDFGVDLGSSNTRDIKIYSTMVTGSERIFDINVEADMSTADPGSYELPASVTIPANSNEGILSLNIKDLNIGIGGKKLVLSLAPKDDLYVGEMITLNIFQDCDSPLVIDFTFDGYADETSWELLNDAGETVITGGNYAQGLPAASSSTCLAPGEYTFNVTDVYGDGLTYPSVGSIIISQAGNVKAFIDGDYGAGTSISFEL